MKKQCYKQDFYQCVNQEWIDSVVIPADKPSISGFAQISLDIEKLLMNLSEEWANGTRSLPNAKEFSPIIEYVKLYKMVANQDKRNQLKFQPIMPYLNGIETLTSFEDIANNFIKLRNEYSNLPFSLEVDDDFKNNKIKTIWFDLPATILPSKNYYGTEKGNHLLKVYQEVLQELLVDLGKTSDEASLLISKALEFDDMLKNYVLSSEEKADYTSLYNPLKIEEYSQLSPLFNVQQIANDIVKQQVDTIVISSPKWIQDFNILFNKDTFESYKAFLYLTNFLSTCYYLDEATRLKAAKYYLAVSGIAEARTFDKYKFDLASSIFGMPLGLYYGKTYFGPEAKKDVETKIAKMINVYKERLENNQWLSKDTIQKALLKLSKLDVMIGYPEQLRPFYNEFTIKDYDQGSNVFENVKAFFKLKKQYKDSLYLKSESNLLWEMKAYEVNAYFHPIKNHIVFPAGILNSPFYNINQSSSTNYGGIGAVIAHEISHAFDNNGAKFDENGEMNNWWTEQDIAKFAEKQAQVIELFDGYESNGFKLNGKLTVSENIADIGGFLCALEAAQREEDFNATEFFESFARIWRQKATPEYWEMLNKVDVHAATRARANINLMNCDLFHETYQTSKDDQMFLAQEKRIKIW